MTQLPTPQKSPRGTALSCKGWQQEAALRLLLNSLDPELAERPKDLLICEGQKAARDWDAFQAIVTALRELESNETFSIQSGAPAITNHTGPMAPRLFLLNHRNDQGAPQQLRRAGNLHRFSQISAASWFFVGSQGALQATYEILGAAARARFGGTLAGKLVVSCGLGAVSGAQPLAATLHGAAALGIEADPEQLKQRVKSGYCEIMVNDLDEALRILKNAIRKREPASVGLLGDCTHLIPELAKRGVIPDLLFPNLLERSTTDSEARGISELENLGAAVLDGETFEPYALIDQYGDLSNSEPLTCIALSGNSADIACADRLLLELSPGNKSLQRWIPLAKRHVRCQGLPARVVWLSRTECWQFAHAVNDMVARSRIQAPIVLALAGSRRNQGDNSAPIEATTSTMRGATLVAIELPGSDNAPPAHKVAYQIASVTVLDGTPAIAEGIEHALAQENAQEGGGHAS